MIAPTKRLLFFDMKWIGLFRISSSRKRFGGIDQGTRRQHLQDIFVMLYSKLLCTENSGSKPK
jgi:hypothetical protein